MVYVNAEYGCMYHPKTVVHTRWANVLIPLMSSVLGWSTVINSCSSLIQLQSGANSQAALLLQYLLNAHGQQPPLVVDGDFGSNTRSAVITFQQLKGLSATGVCDTLCWQWLLGAQPNATAHQRQVAAAALATTAGQCALRCATSSAGGATGALNTGCCPGGSGPLPINATSSFRQRFSIPDSADLHSCVWPSLMGACRWHECPSLGAIVAPPDPGTPANEEETDSPAVTQPASGSELSAALLGGLIAIVLGKRVTLGCRGRVVVLLIELTLALVCVLNQ
jgi:hypothetical protein